jgi:hypothetical protein
VFHELVSHNDDIRRLVEKGYAVGFDSGYLVVRDIPYLEAERRLKTGAIVTKLTPIDKYRFAKPDDHQIFFCGSPPHQMDGSAIANLGGGPVQVALAGADLKVERSFSNKPPEGFANFFDKIESYVRIICGPAIEVHGVTPLTFKVEKDVVGQTVFKFWDSLTSRAAIGDLSAKFKDEVIAIIGLGGTGSYILDFMVKTPVREIRAFDLDRYHIHNAFRSPGRLDEHELGLTKAEVYRSRYDNFRHGLTIEARFLDDTSGDALEGVTFAFVAVDKGSSRAGIFDLLIAKKIPFIDVGMGLNRTEAGLGGMLRATYYPVESAAELKAKGLAELVDHPDDEYNSNIQIGELNALNAAYAVAKYKKLIGFYVDDGAHNTIIKLENLKCFGEMLDL